MQAVAGVTFFGQMANAYTPNMAGAAGGATQGVVLFPHTPAATQQTVSKGAVLAVIEEANVALAPAQKIWEFKWQQEKDKDEFKEEVLAYQAEVQAFAVVQPKSQSQTIKVVNGLGKYFHPSATLELQGRVLGHLATLSSYA